MKCTGPQLLLFRDALVAAFNKPAAMDEFALATGQIDSLEEVGGDTLKEVGLNFLRLVQAQGEAALDEILRLALERRPGNEKLLAFAKTVGGMRAAAAADLLNMRSFDLRPLEDVWRRELSEPEKRLVVFMLFGAEPNVVGNVVDRLRFHLGQSISSFGPTYMLDAQLTSISRTVGLVAQLKSRLANSGFVCTVHAHAADDVAIDQLLIALYGIYPDVLSHPLILLVSARPEGKVNARCVRLPKPEFHKSHLYEWVDDVTAGKGWPDDLRAEFKKWLHRATEDAETPATDVAYFALGGAIELLSQNLSLAALRERFRLPL